jgi:DNA-binding transcriptional regulator YhcF (GntR family)
MASRYWIKLYHEILDDPKMGHLSHRAWRRALELMLVAGEMNREGQVPSTGELAWRLRCDIAELGEDLKALETVGIVSPNGQGWIVTHFAERQAPVSDTERQRRHRRRDTAAQYYGHESVTIRDTDKIRRDQDTDGEENQIRTREEASKEFVAGAFSAYQNTIGLVSGATQRDAIIDILEELEKRGVESWWQMALNISADQNKRSLAYVRGILKRCLAEGRPPLTHAMKPSKSQKRLVTVIDPDTGEKMQVEATI